MDDNTSTPPVVAAPVEQTATLNTNYTPEATPPETSSFKESIPEAYRDKEYLKNADSMESLLDQYENAQKLIGKKQIPGADATPEEMTEFYNKLRPESPDKYNFEYQEGAEVNQEFETSMKSIFHEAGLSEGQAKLVQTKYDELVNGMMPDPGAQDAEFDKMFADHFGDRQDDATRKANQLLSEFAPESMRAAIAELGNNELLLLTSVLDGVANKYISEDRIAPSGGNNTPVDARAKARELMASDAYKNAFHPDHLSIKAQVKELYGAMN